jgi:hypothetical protein
LYSGVDRNGTHTRDRGAFIETVAADDLAARLGDHTIETGMAEHHRKDARIERTPVGTSTDGKSGGKACSVEIFRKAS